MLKCGYRNKIVSFYSRSNGWMLIDFKRMPPDESVEEVSRYVASHTKLDFYEVYKILSNFRRKITQKE